MTLEEVWYLRLRRGFSSYSKPRFLPLGPSWWSLYWHRKDLEILSVGKALIDFSFLQRSELGFSYNLRVIMYPSILYRSAYHVLNGTCRYPFVWTSSCSSCNTCRCLGSCFEPYSLIRRQTGYFYLDTGGSLRAPSVFDMWVHSTFSHEWLLAKP